VNDDVADLRPSNPTLRAWRLVDGRRGHENMSRALLAELERRLPITSVDVPSRSWRERVGAVYRSIALALDNHGERPNLIIGVGHRTHFALAIAARMLAAKSVVILKPTLPLRWFDYAIIPAHDNVAAGQTRFVTRGALNRMQPAAECDPDLALVLVGGPSKHHTWVDREVVETIGAVVDQDAAEHIVIATSRRTPSRTTQLLRQRLASCARASGRRIELIEPHMVSDDWLMDTLAVAERAWVSEDSVSMVYEALSAGCRTGILPVSRRSPTRVVKHLLDLVGDGSVARFRGTWLEPVRMLDRTDWPAEPLGVRASLNEAARAGEWVAQRLGLDR
jgi:mitochondrial fission protein ELM1